VEYAVKMRKLEDQYFMLRLLEHNQITTRDLNRVVSKLKDFYEAETPTQKITKWGRIEKLKISTAENFDQTREFVGLTISRAAFEAIVLSTAAFYDRNAELFKSRLRGHRIRVRKELAGIPLYERDEKSALRLYSEAMTTETYKILFQCAASQLDRHASVIFVTASEFSEILSIVDRQKLRKCPSDYGSN